ncbi:MAG: NAD(P)H-hydrate dehydratase, partial [Actinobacteria bacterium]|nr:NAD(P)H-hydrate dehydratase [Actinomycetota bacterium]
AAALSGAVVVLKGAPTVVAAPDGTAYLNPTGNPALATAGSGDVLTGIISGLIAQGLTPREAAVAGVYLHGVCGDLAAGPSPQRKGVSGTVAGDLVDLIPEALRELHFAPKY